MKLLLVLLVLTVWEVTAKPVPEEGEGAARGTDPCDSGEDTRHMGCTLNISRADSKEGEGAARGADGGIVSIKRHSL